MNYDRRPERSVAELDAEARSSTVAAASHSSQYCISLLNGAMEECYDNATGRHAQTCHIAYGVRTCTNH